MKGHGAGGTGSTPGRDIIIRGVMTGTAVNEEIITKGASNDKGLWQDLLCLVIITGDKGLWQDLLCLVIITADKGLWQDLFSHYHWRWTMARDSVLIRVITGARRTCYLLGMGSLLSDKDN